MVRKALPLAPLAATRLCSLAVPLTNLTQPSHEAHQMYLHTLNVSVGSGNTPVGAGGGGVWEER